MANSTSSPQNYFLKSSQLPPEMTTDMRELWSMHDMDDLTSTRRIPTLHKVPRAVVEKYPELKKQAPKNGDIITLEYSDDVVENIAQGLELSEDKPDQKKMKGIKSHFDELCDANLLLTMILVTGELGLTPLVDALSKYVAERVKDCKTSEEVKAMFEG